MHSSPRAAVPPLDPRVWRIACVVLLGPLMTALDSTVVNVSLARLGQDLGVPLTTIQWVTSGYLLALALMLPLCGWLVDRIGAKRVYLASFTAFTLASMLCGWAGSARSLIGFRVLQGMAGGLLVPMAQLVTAREAGPHVARVMGYMVMPVLLGAIGGPVLAGFILQHGSWRWIFFLNLPVGLLATVLAAWLLPGDQAETRPRPFDLAGSSLAELAAALGLLAGFLGHARRRGGAALVQLDLFRSRSFNAAAATQFLANAVACGGQMLLPLYLLTVRRASPAQVGFLLIPGGLGIFCTIPFIGHWTERFGSRRVSSAGALLALAGTLPFAWAGFARSSAGPLCLALGVQGAGLGAIGIPSIAAAYADIPREALPVATTALNIVQRLGGPAATTALAIFLQARVLALGATPGAFAGTFLFLCAIDAGAVLSALRLPAGAGRHAPARREPRSG